MKMRDLLSIEQVIPSLRARNKRDALRRLRRTPLATCLPLKKPLYASCWRAPNCQLSAQAPGYPSLMLSCRDSAILFVTFARLEPAVDFGAADGSKTDLVALLLSPADNAGDHLRALACIARTLRDSHRAQPSACGEQSRVCLRHSMRMRGAVLVTRAFVRRTRAAVAAKHR